MDNRTRRKGVACVLLILFFFSCLTLNHVYFLDRPSSSSTQLQAERKSKEEFSPSSSSEVQIDQTMTLKVNSQSYPSLKLTNERRKVPYLLSASKKVRSNTRGNLGPPEVVTNDEIKNWLNDRWQAASDMRGTPLKGKHWLEIDLGKSCILTSTLLDFEAAYSQDWTIEGKADFSSTNWFDVTSSKSPTFQQTKLKLENYDHVIQIVNITNYNYGAAEDQRHDNYGIDKRWTDHDGNKVRYVRLVINSSSTRWGTSVWRWKLFGFEL